MHESASEPFGESVTLRPDRCPNPRCGRVLDAESIFRARCSCGCVLPGNQIKRKYPRPADDDPAVQQQLAARRSEIETQRGGRDRLSPMQLSEIRRYVILEAFVESWESYFMKASPISRQGRVRSGYREGYLSSLDRLIKLWQQIGVEPVSRDIDVSQMSIEEYVQAQTQRGSDEDEPAS